MQEALALVGPELVRFDEDNQAIELLKQDMRIDLGGIAKGFGRGSIPTATLPGSIASPNGSTKPSPSGRRVPQGNGLQCSVTGRS